MSRRVSINTSLGEQLKFRQLNGSEALSTLYALDIDLVSDSKGVEPKALLGKTATVEVETDGGGKRFIDGIVTRFGMQGQDHSKFRYKLLLRPWFWLATRKTNFKIYQFKTVPDILDEVLGPYGYPFEKKLTRAYRAWDYCVQYHESDHNFLSRLCELEGIYYYFTHSSGQHTLVFADDVTGSHSPLPGGATIPFYPPEKAAVAEKESIYSWELGEDIQSGRHYNDDYDFKKPKADLSNMRQMPPGHAHDKYENYEWPGGYTEFGDGETYARVRLEEQLSPRSRVLGVSNHRCLAPGYTTTLTNYPREDQNQQYLIVSVHYHFQENPEVSEGGAGRPPVQRLTLQAQPTSVVFRPPRVTPKPRTQGPQTAVVVGPAGEEIWVDKYGRVKVQFHWDRLGAMDENSSCWVRVSSSWAGSNFGGIFIPRIGMEVIIDHLNGDPDYPILTGVVYNANNMPPWDLPANATQSGWLTRSSKGGAPGAGMKSGAGDANAIRFEDKAGAEQLWLHAQKDQLTEVEHDEDKWVGNDRRKTVDRDETNVIHRDRTETVDRNEKITVHGWRTEEVDGDETITIHSNRTERVDLNERISIGMNRSEDVGISETVTVGVNQAFTVGTNRTKTIGVNETDSIGTKWSINVGSIKSESIGMMSMSNIGLGKVQSIGVFRMNNVGVAYNLNVGMAMMTNVGLMRSDNVGMNWSRTVGGNRSASIGANDSVNVGANQAVIVGTDHALTVGANSAIKAGTQVAIAAGSEVTVDGAKVVLTGVSSIRLQCGASVIELTPGMIEIDAPLVKINS
jgi:type VI secretion system secreted protein VgrG